MKIYFTASSKYRNKCKAVYEKIVDCLQAQGHEVFEKVLSEHLPNLSETPIHKVKGWYKEWSSYIRECDCIIVEGSYPSTINVGFEVGMILSRDKPVILLFQQGKDPVFINHLYSSRLIRSEYTDNNVKEVLIWCFKELKQVLNRRFTFFVPPEIDLFLDETSKKNNISRSEYIRTLIENEMEKKRQ